MPWQWVNDLLAPENKKKDMSWDARCPYFGCPSNTPFRGAHKPRLKFVQKVAPLIYQYKCKDCGCLCNHGVEVPDDSGNELWRKNPALYGGKESYK